MTLLAQTDLVALTQACLDQIAREEAFLRGFADSLSELQAALRCGDLAAVQSAARRHAEFADRAELIDRTRQSFRRSAAATLGIPATRASLGHIASLLPDPWSERIHRASLQLMTLAEQTRGQARRTAGILTCCQAFTRKFLAEVYGSDETANRYGPTGAVYAIAPANSVTGVL